MASFPVHISTAMAVSGVCAITLLAAGIATTFEVILYFTLGVIGGISPDVDSDNSTPLRIAFEALSLIGSSMLVFKLSKRLSILELCLVWVTTFLVLRYGLFYAFTRLTVHRGIFHSIPAAFLFGFLTAIVGYRLGGLKPLSAWIAGAFMTGGYLVHLILDELYSVNLYGGYIKRSFGTAFKIFAPRSPVASLLLYIVLIGAWQFTPDTQPFMSTFKNIKIWQRIENRLLPDNTWLHKFLT